MASLLQAEAIASAAALHGEVDQLRQQLASEVAALQAALAEQRERAAAAEEEGAAERAAEQERSGHMQSRVRRPGAGVLAVVGAAVALLPQIEPCSLLPTTCCLPAAHNTSAPHSPLSAGGRAVRALAAP